MAGQGLNFLDRRAGPDQRRDEVSTERMEVGHPFIGLVRDAGGGQVGADRLGGLMVERENRHPGGLAAEPGGQVERQGQRDRLFGRAAVLRRTGTEEDGRLGTVQAERLGGQVRSSAARNPVAAATR